MALIFGGSSVPGTQLPGSLWDKLVHFLVYGLLGILFLLPLAEGRWSGVTARTAVLAVVFSMVYGISDELHQRFTPDRTSDALDVIADTIGAGVAVLCVVALRLLAKRRSTE
jgi:VanZ family protein